MTAASLEQKSARLQALAAMVASSLFFALMGACTKTVSRRWGDGPAIPGAEIACFRYLCGIVALMVVGRLRGTDLMGSDRRGLLLRGIFGGVSSTFFFLGIQFTSLTNATLLNYTYVVWAPLIAVFLLGEPLGRRGTLAVITALVGVILVTRPEGSYVRAGDVIALISGLISGVAVVQIRRLRRTESSFAIFFYFNLLGVPVSLITLLLTRTPLVLPTLSHLPILLVLGATSVGAQLLMTYGYRALTAAQGSLLALTTAIYAALFGYFLFAEPLKSTTLLGAALILLGTAAINLRPRTE